jgi:hypothetical protein
MQDVGSGNAVESGRRMNSVKDGDRLREVPGKFRPGPRSDTFQPHAVAVAFFLQKQRIT